MPRNVNVSLSRFLLRLLPPAAAAAAPLTTLASGCNYWRGGGRIGMRPDPYARGVFSEAIGGV